ARNRVLAGMRLEIADHHVEALLLQVLRFFERLVRLADAGRVPHEDLQLAALVFGHCGKIRTSMPRDLCTSFSTGLPSRRGPRPERWLWPMKSCVMPREWAKSRIAVTGSMPSRISICAPAARAVSRRSSSAALSSAEMLG